MSDEYGAGHWNSVSTAFRSGAAQRLWRDHSDQVYLALLTRWIRTGRRKAVLKTDLFDEAVAAGLIPYLQAHADVVRGIDLAGDVVEAARIRYPDADLRQADVRRLPHEDGSFDLVLSNSTLDHFKSSGDIDIALCEIHRVLRPGGELLLSMDNAQNPIVRLRNALPFGLLNRLGLVPYFVGETVDRRGLEARLNRAGFRIVETRSILHCPRVLVIPVARWMHGKMSESIQRKFLRWLLKFEKLANWPSANFTGYYVAARAVKQ